MSARRVLLFLWSWALLLVLLPQQFSKTQKLPTAVPKASNIQVDTFLGTWLVERFPLDYLVLPYIDGYGKLIDITYTEYGRGIGLLEPVVPIKSPYGFCIVLDKLRRGKFLPATVTGWYDKASKYNQPLKTDMLKLFDEIELTALCEYWKQETQLRAELATVGALQHRIKEFNGAILLLHGYYPIYLYDYDSSCFYAYDPLTKEDVANVVIEKDNTLVYRNGFLTYIGGEMICSD